MRAAIFCGILFFLCGTFAFAEKSKSYQELAITSSQQEDIRTLITTLAETSHVGLVFKKTEIEEIGGRINGIHPLRYIGFIYGDPSLKPCMPKLLKKAIVATRFVNELSAGLNEKLEQGELLPYVSGFALSLDLKESAIMPYFEGKDWKGLLTYLNTH